MMRSDKNENVGGQTSELRKAPLSFDPLLTQKHENKCKGNTESSMLTSLLS